MGFCVIVAPLHCRLKWILVSDKCIIIMYCNHKFNACGIIFDKWCSKESGTPTVQSRRTLVGEEYFDIISLILQLLFHSVDGIWISLFSLPLPPDKLPLIIVNGACISQFPISLLLLIKILPCCYFQLPGILSSLAKFYCWQLSLVNSA